MTDGQQRFTKATGAMHRLVTGVRTVEVDAEGQWVRYARARSGFSNIELGLRSVCRQELRYSMEYRFRSILAKLHLNDHVYEPTPRIMKERLLFHSKPTRHDPMQG
uniref:Uncharacterized protein n=1 Tax=Candidatus Kentrum sp. FW TaxID=2126338 RepID=A0A450TC41_9GAMM|nr:MAG: hypothetical protein BECKFW1821A_GA0114235_11692 [Candidatus Kentron sp. FW]